jgi:NAD(P)-dependent dehydrogenase (short-subunit alcohol dehydrogenase family)
MGVLDGRVVIVTGAAQGIGAAYARGMAAEGALVVVNDVINPEPVAADIRKAGGQAVAATADVTDDIQIAGMVKAARDAFGGRIDALVNNAALFGKLKRRRFEDIDALEFDAVLRVNIRGVWQMTRAVVPIMRGQKYGKIVNIASGTVFKGSPMQLHYVTSKGAIIAMSRALAREVGDDNICVNSIAPGLTESEAVLSEGQFGDEHFRANIASRCIRRAETPDDLVGAAVFLASADSDFMTGQVICVDGGSVMN